MAIKPLGTTRALVERIPDRMLCLIPTGDHMYPAQAACRKNPPLCFMELKSLVNSPGTVLITGGPLVNSTRYDLMAGGPLVNSTRHDLMAGGPLVNSPKHDLMAGGPLVNSPTLHRMADGSLHTVQGICDCLF